MTSLKYQNAMNQLLASKWNHSYGSSEMKLQNIIKVKETVFPIWNHKPSIIVAGTKGKGSVLRND